jgi:capsid protein
VCSAWLIVKILQEDNMKMGILDRIKAFMPVREVVKKEVPRATGSGIYTTMFSHSYDGEKNLGEIGPIKNYSMDYGGLRMRSWQSFIESEITQTIIKRYVKWVVGKGLKLQAEPAVKVLNLYGINLDRTAFCDSVEALFNVFRSSNRSSYSGMQNLDATAKEAFKNAIVGGDVLVVLRYENDDINVQLIDGAHIKSPMFGTEYYPQDLPNGNKIIEGIEIDEKGNHVRYYVQTTGYKFVPIEAIGKESGLQMAFLVYGLKYRLDNVRGIPLISCVLESLKKLERYKEATVGSAEERQKISFSIEHGLASGGENPFAKGAARAFDYDGAADLPKDINGVELANQVAATTNKQVVNMPIGAQLKMLESKNELYFKDFYNVNSDSVSASVGIPPEVALSKYDSNFSASRAALKDWEHTLTVDRYDFYCQFYQPIYVFALEVMILKNKVKAPGYMAAKLSKNGVVLDAFRMSRFVGAPVPHIDPLKEVEAERAKLGSNAAHLPFTTLEAATENLNGGESNANLEQFAAELDAAKNFKIEPVQQQQNEKAPTNNQ